MYHCGEDRHAKLGPDGSRVHLGDTEVFFISTMEKLIFSIFLLGKCFSRIVSVCRCALFLKALPLLEILWELFLGIALSHFAIHQ